MVDVVRLGREISPDYMQVGLSAGSSRRELSRGMSDQFLLKPCQLYYPRLKFMFLKKRFQHFFGGYTYRCLHSLVIQCKHLSSSTMIHDFKQLVIAISGGTHRCLGASPTLGYNISLCHVLKRIISHKHIYVTNLLIIFWIKLFLNLPDYLTYSSGGEISAHQWYIDTAQNIFRKEEK